MTRGEYLLRGECHSLPSGAELPESLDGPFAVCAVLRRSGHQVRNRLAVPGYGYSLSALDDTEKLGQARLGFGGLNLAHVQLQPVVLTVLF